MAASSGPERRKNVQTTAAASPTPNAPASHPQASTPNGHFLSTTTSTKATESVASQHQASASRNRCTVSRRRARRTCC